MPTSSNFSQDVYDLVRLIPEGRVTTYGAIARYLGKPRSARLVGWAMNNSFKEGDVPAHRVVNREGLLTGKHHFSPPTAMQERLEAEGIEVKDDQIQQFAEVFWNPSENLL